MSKYMRAVMVLTLMLFIGISGAAQRYEIKRGDLLFKQTESAEGFEKAVAEATSSVEDYKFSHVGVVMNEKGEDAVVAEAVFSGVKLTPLKEFMEKDSGVIAIMRLEKPYRKAIPDALKKISKLIGKEYDKEFLPGNDKYYCSELVESCFLLNGKPIFKRQSMNFKNLETGAMPEYWMKYFEELGKPIPQGVDGTNPSDMSKSKALKLVSVVRRYGTSAKER